MTSSGRGCPRSIWSVIPVNAVMKGGKANPGCMSRQKVSTGW